MEQQATPPARRRKQRVGEVVSDKMDKTVVVRVMRTHRHPLYKKTIRTSKKFMAHNPDNLARQGDYVRIEECRPLSRRKRWRVVEIIARGGQPAPTRAELVEDVSE